VDFWPNASQSNTGATKRLMEQKKCASEDYRSKHLSIKNNSPVLKRSKRATLSKTRTELNLHTKRIATGIPGGA